jgi:hypothetical protein
MTQLDNYLAAHYLTTTQLAVAAGLTVAELDAMVANRLVPAPSYVVEPNGTVVSFVFGAMAAPGTKPGRYFHPAQLAWLARARNGLGTEAHAKGEFTTAYAAALATLNSTTWRLVDSFDALGAPIAAGLDIRLEAAWTYFLNGTFGLCVANPVSEAAIAYKEVLQEKLMALSENGEKRVYPAQQARAVQELIDAYAAAAMPFSPIDYPVSSRKRLVEDLRATMRVTEEAT